MARFKSQAIQAGIFHPTPLEAGFGLNGILQGRLSRAKLCLKLPAKERDGHFSFVDFFLIVLGVVLALAFQCPIQ